MKNHHTKTPGFNETTPGFKLLTQKHVKPPFFVGRVSLKPYKKKKKMRGFHIKTSFYSFFGQILAMNTRNILIVVNTRPAALLSKASAGPQRRENSFKAQNAFRSQL